MSDKPLRECPFCGGEAALDYGFDGGVFIECHTCHASTNIRHSEMDDARELVRAAWNTRPAVTEEMVGRGCAAFREELFDRHGNLESSTRAALTAALSGSSTAALGEKQAAEWARAADGVHPTPEPK